MRNGPQLRGSIICLRNSKDQSTITDCCGAPCAERPRTQRESRLSQQATWKKLINRSQSFRRDAETWKQRRRVADRNKPCNAGTMHPLGLRQPPTIETLSQWLQKTEERERTPSPLFFLRTQTGWKQSRYGSSWAKTKTKKQGRSPRAVICEVNRYLLNCRYSVKRWSLAHGFFALLIVKICEFRFTCYVKKKKRLFTVGFLFLFSLFLCVIFFVNCCEGVLKDVRSVLWKYMRTLNQKVKAGSFLCPGPFLPGVSPFQPLPCHSATTLVSLPLRLFSPPFAYFFAKWVAIFSNIRIQKYCIKPLSHIF